MKRSRLYNFAQRVTADRKIHAIAHFIYRLLMKPLSKMIIPVIFTTSISLIAKFTTSISLWLAISGVFALYCVYLAVAFVVDEHTKFYFTYHAYFEHIIRRLTKLTSRIANHLYKPNEACDIRDDNAVSLQVIAAMVCGSIYDLFSQTLSTPDIYVSFYYRGFHGKNDRGAKRAHNMTLLVWNHKYIDEKILPHNYRKKYPILPPEVGDGIRPPKKEKTLRGEGGQSEERESSLIYQQRIFNEKITHNTIMLKKDEIHQNNVYIGSPPGYHDEYAHQYIALPVYCKKNGVVGILQIVVYNGNHLGDDIHITERLVQALEPMANLLRLQYLRDTDSYASRKSTSVSKPRPLDITSVQRK